MKKTLSKVLIGTAVALIGASNLAFAASSPAIDFSLLGPVGAWGGGSTASVSGITIDAFKYTPATSYVATDLWLRNSYEDHGFGVCSEGVSSCTSGGGNVNELDNLGNDEVIRLTKGTDNWSDVFVSSLDSSEVATIYWSNDAAANLNTLTTKVEVASGWLGAGVVEGSILAQLNAAAWDPSSTYLYFRAGGSIATTTDNDYLVWGVTAIPEPETYAMLLAGLGLMGFVARRRQRNAAA